MLLEYERQALDESSGQNCLLVMAGGLNIQGIIAETIRPHLNRASRVLLVNFGAEDKAMLLGIGSPFLHDMGALPKVKRKEKYLHGGVFIASNWVFLADMIDGTVEAEKIDSVLVNNAEMVMEASPEAFVVHVFRSKNRSGVVQGFSESPVPLSLGFAPLGKRMRSLKVNKAVFFPRFHTAVEDSLKGDVGLVELKFGLPACKRQLQVILLEILDGLLRAALRGSDREEVDAEAMIFGNICKIFKQVRVLSNRIVEDVYDIRTLVFLLFSGDAGLFYEYVKAIVRKQVELGRDGTWINLPISHVLVEKAKEQFEEALEKVAGCGKRGGEEEEDRRKRACRLSDDAPCPPGLCDEDLKTFYIHNPKIKKVVEILHQVKGTASVVLVSGQAVKSILSRVLGVFGLVADEGSEEHSEVKIMTHYEFKYHEESYENAIFVESGQDSVRKIERHGVLRHIKTFFLMYSGSLEEQRYLSEMRREKASFEKLIEERSRLPVRLDDMDDVIDLEEHDGLERDYAVVVDSRELRSELPFYLFRARNRISVSTLPVGDYLVSPTVCIERKSVPDLISSLNTGRLYLQTSMLCHRYSSPILLLEFDGRPCLSDHYRYDQDTFRNSVVAKLALLLFNFGTLRIIWSESRLSSTKMIRDLQRREDTVPEAWDGGGMDPVLQEILLSIPGISQFNVQRVRRSFRNLRDIMLSTRERLEQSLGREDAARVYGFFRQRCAGGNKTNGGSGADEG